MTPTEFEHELLLMRPKLVRVAFDFFHNREDAEDVVQEVYVRLLERGYVEGDNLEPLAIRATKNLCVSVWRRMKLREARGLNEVAETMDITEADSHILQKEHSERLEKAINQLPPSEQRLIRLRHDEGLKSEEISKQTGIPIRSVSTMLSSAKKRLRTLLTNKKI